MTREEILAERLILPPCGLPEVINDLTIELRHTPEAVAAGVTERVAEELEDQFKETRRLFAAGFAAMPGQDASRFKARVSTEEGRITVEIAGCGASADAGMASGAASRIRKPDAA